MFAGGGDRRSREIPGSVPRLLQTTREHLIQVLARKQASQAKTLVTSQRTRETETVWHKSEQSGGCCCSKWGFHGYGIAVSPWIKHIMVPSWVQFQVVNWFLYKFLTAYLVFGYWLYQKSSLQSCSLCV